MAQSKTLPARPNLEHLKKQAKQRLVELRHMQPGAKLAQAQLEIAREYGFTSWRALQASLRVKGDDVLAELSKIFKTFAQVECAGRSQLYEQLSHAIADDAELLSLASNGRVPIPNLFLAAVHYLLLRDPSAPLARFYPSIDRSAQPAQDAAPEFRQFCLSHRAEIINVMRARRVQTNEVARSGYLLPAFALAAQMAKDQPLALIEIGASAGLNLCFDHYAFDYGPKFGVRGDRGSRLKLAVELRGTIPPPIPDTPPKIAQRIGLDLAPVNAGDPDGVAWLEALVWPEHHERREQLQAALAIAQNVPMRMVAGDATKLLAGVVESIPADRVPCVFQTHTLNQLSFESRTQLMKILNELGAKRELLFISRDNRLTLDHYRAGAKDVILLAECDAHGKWIEWKAQPSAEPNLEQFAQRTVAKMERGWAESAAVVERYFEDPGDEPRWESTDTYSPTLREREADAVIQQRELGLYRIISIWLGVKVESGWCNFGPIAPRRSLQFYRGGDATVRPMGGQWRRVALPSPTGPALGKAGRWEDIAAALRLVPNLPAGLYRVSSVRRMLRAERVKGRIRIVKKHSSDSLPCLAPVDQSAPAKKEWSVETLPEHRKSHKITKWKPIMDAAYVGDAVKVAKLLDAGADPNVVSTTPHRYRPLHRAIEHKKTAPKHEGHDRAVATLLERGADSKQRATMSALTALQLAAMGEPRFVPMLIDRFRPLDLFHAAVVLDDRSVSELLTKEPKLAESRDANNFTALHYAAASVLFTTSDDALRSQLRIVRALLAAGADPKATYAWENKWPIPVMYHSAGAHDNPTVTKLLLEAGATPFDNESVYHASDEGHHQCLDLFDKMCDAKKLAKECTMCLVSQLHWGHTNGMNWLLEHGANPNAIHQRYGESALHAAIQSKRSEAVLRTLLKHGADVNVKTTKGKTAIQLARAAGSTSLRRLEAARSG